MSTYAGGDSFGFDRLSLKTEDGRDEFPPDFRLYARQHEEIKPGGGGGGSHSSQYHPGDPSTFSSSDAQNQFDTFSIESENIFGTMEQVKDLRIRVEFFFSDVFFSPPVSDSSDILSD